MEKLFLIPQKTTDPFNKYFVDIGYSISKSIPENSSHVKDFASKNINLFLLKYAEEKKSKI